MKKIFFILFFILFITFPLFAADKYVTVAGAGAKTGGSWSDAFGLVEWESDIELVAVAGDIYWVAGGTYAQASAINSARDGSAVNPIQIIGVVSGTTNEPPTASDHADGASRPFIDGGSSWGFVLDNYWTIKNMRFESSVNPVLRGDNDFLLVNCKIVSNGSSLIYYAIRKDAGRGIIVDCEIIALVSSGVQLGSDVVFINTYFKCAKALEGGTGIKIYESIFDSCGVGVEIVAGALYNIVGGTFYDCTTAISGTTGASNLIFNNTFSECVDAIKFTSTSPQLWIDYNNYYNNTTDVTGVIKGPNALAVDPEFTDGPGGDFSLESTSGLYGEGFSIRLGVGL